MSQPFDSYLESITSTLPYFHPSLIVVVLDYSLQLFIPGCFLILLVNLLKSITTGIQSDYVSGLSLPTLRTLHSHFVVVFLSVVVKSALVLV